MNLINLWIYGYDVANYNLGLNVHGFSGISYEWT